MNRHHDPSHTGGKPEVGEFKSRLAEGSNSRSRERAGRPTPDTEGLDEPEVAELYALVAERLKQAHARVCALNVSEESKTVLTRQLLIVTEAAKRDLPEAARRLSRFVQAMDEGRTPRHPSR